MIFSWFDSPVVVVGGMLLDLLLFGGGMLLDLLLFGGMLRELFEFRLDFVVC
jgi:hypothetical protein